MNKTIFGGSLASVIFLIVGSFVFPSSPIMWLASTGIIYSVIRFLMAALLIAVIVSNPPRRRSIRLAMGGMGAFLVAWGLLLAVTNSMHLLDIVLFLEVGIAFGLEALELNEEEIDERTERLWEPEQSLAAPIAWQLLRNYSQKQWHELLTRRDNWRHDFQHVEST